MITLIALHRIPYRLFEMDLDQVNRHEYPPCPSSAHL